MRGPVAVLDRLGSSDKLNAPGTVPSSFITGSSELPEVTEASPWHVKYHRLLKKALYSQWFESAIGTVILFNFLLICFDTDARADFPGRSHGHHPPHWVERMLGVCFLVFVLELVLRVVVEREKVVHEFWNYVDLFIVVSGCLEYILEWSGVALEGKGLLRAIHLLRLLRIIRAMRLFSVLKELRKLVIMMGSCFRTLFWSCFLLALVMTMWATILVELINPFVVELAEQGKWPGCERCPRAFSSVFMANITLFQTIVAGDSWGYMAIPVIEVAPWTAVLFTAVLMTLVFGVLSLIMAVVLDTFAENRAKDVLSRATDLEEDEVKEKKILSKIFQKIDEDGDGTLSFEELQEGARRVAEFRNWLRVLDIDAHDLQELFTMIDHDESGEIDPNEFIEAMYRMKNTESKTATRFVKHMVSGMSKRAGNLEVQLGEVNTRMANWEGALEKNFSQMELGVEATDAQWVKYHQEMEDKLQGQEAAIQKAIEDAMKKASEVALEAALEAAALAAKNVMTAVSSSSKMLVGGAHSKLDWQRDASGSSMRTESSAAPVLDLGTGEQPEATALVTQMPELDRDLPEPPSSSYVAVCGASLALTEPTLHSPTEKATAFVTQMPELDQDLPDSGRSAGPKGPTLAPTAPPTAFLPGGFQRVPLAPQAL